MMAEKSRAIPEREMSLSSSRRALRASALACLVGAAAASAAMTQQAAPDFSSNDTGWVSAGDLAPVPGSPPIVRNDPAHRYVPNNTDQQPTYRIGDTSNPNLKPWVRERMRKDNDEVLAGKIAFTARQSCMPAGVPGFFTYPVRPVYFLQTPKQVLIIYSGDEQIRHVYLDQPHSPNSKPSWYGESIGHYEGDTLIVDTIGMNDKTFVDNFRTPHSEKMHVVERYRMVDGGKMMEVNIRVEDPDAFNEPWSAIKRYRRVTDPMGEEVCAENNNVLFDYHIPVANKPDF
jgi:hypothetical protein